MTSHNSAEFGREVACLWIANFKRSIKFDSQAIQAPGVILLEKSGAQPQAASSKRSSLECV
jgi:hypothetical protein